MVWRPLIFLAAALVAAVLGFGGFAGEASWAARGAFFLALALWAAALTFGPRAAAPRAGPAGRRGVGRVTAAVGESADAGSSRPPARAAGRPYDASGRGVRPVRNRAHYRRHEVMAMLDAPAVVTDLPGGGVRFEKAGATGAGATHRDAVADWGREFARLLASPKPPGSAAGADTNPHAPLVIPGGDG